MAASSTAAAPGATPTTSRCASGLVVEWAEDDGSSDVDRNVLSASCSRASARRPDAAVRPCQPAGDDLDGRRSDSIAACIEPMSPQAAANLPAEVTIGTAGETTTIGELQLDPAALDPETLGASPENTAAVERVHRVARRRVAPLRLAPTLIGVFVLSRVSRSDCPRKHSVSTKHSDGQRVSRVGAIVV